MANRDLGAIQKRVISVLANNVKSFEQVIIIEARKTLRRVRASMLVIYEKYSVDGMLSRAEMTKFNRLKNLEGEITGMMKAHGINTVSKVKDFSDIEFNESYFRYGWSIDQSSGIKLQWGQPIDLKAVAQLKQVGDLVVKDSLFRFSTDAINRMKSAVLSGVLRGDSIQKMSKAITRALEMTTNSALRIARTEANRVAELGHYATFLDAKKQGVRLKRQLISVIDLRTRPQSAQMDGQTSNEDGLFEYPDGGFYLPGNTGTAAWDINDRERTVEIVEDYAPRLRRVRSEGVIPFTTFREWAKDKNVSKNIYNQKLFGG